MTSTATAPISPTSKRSPTTSYTYDSQGRQTEVLYPDGTTQSCTWYSNDLKQSDTDAYGQTTSYHMTATAT